MGLEFIGSAGLRWRCTDVGKRTVLAIPLERKNPDWYRCPPYILSEVVFDESEFGGCHLTTQDAVGEAVRTGRAKPQPVGGMLRTVDCARQCAGRNR